MLLTISAAGRSSRSRSSGRADKLDPVGQAGVGDPLAGLLDRVGVAVDPDDRAGREVLGQPDQADPGAAGAVHDRAAAGEPFGQAGHLPEAAGDQPGVEGGAGPGHVDDPGGAAPVPPQPVARGQGGLEAAEHLVLLQHAEDPAGVGRRAGVEQQGGHVGGQPVAVAVAVADPGRQRRPAPHRDVEGVEVQPLGQLVRVAPPAARSSAASRPLRRPMAMARWLA